MKIKVLFKEDVKYYNVKDICIRAGFTSCQRGIVNIRYNLFNEKLRKGGYEGEYLTGEEAYVEEYDLIKCLSGSYKNVDLLNEVLEDMKNRVLGVN